jgi:ribosomal protein L11 methyltransferase
MPAGRHATTLEALRVVVPEAALEAYEAALGQVCETVGFFLDDASGLWTVEGLRAQDPAATGTVDARLAELLALARAASGVEAAVTRETVPADGWLARSFSAFPEQRIGRRFLLRGTHLPPLAAAPGRIVLVLDAAAAFGSGEHASTRGCLLALERVARRAPRRIADIGTGTGVLAMAAARLLHRPVLATDIDPWAVRTARANLRLNGLSRRVAVERANGWHMRGPRRFGTYDLVLANILARPLIGMAGGLALHLAPGGWAVLSGLLRRQARWVLAAHRARHLLLAGLQDEDGWATLILRKPGHRR